VIFAMMLIVKIVQKVLAKQNDCEKYSKAKLGLYVLGAKILI